MASSDNDPHVGGRRHPKAGRGLTARITRPLRAHPVVSATLAGLVIVTAAVVLLVFQPQRLLYDVRVDEAIPSTTQAARNGQPPGNSVQPAPRTLRSGPFHGLEHPGSGQAHVLELADGSRLLRLENLRVSNGPLLHVYLSEIPAGDDWFAYRERFVDLGALKGNIGSQNYLLPNALQLDRYRSAVVWCKRFSVGFAVAPLA